MLTLSMTLPSILKGTEQQHEKQNSCIKSCVENNGSWRKTVSRVSSTCLNVQIKVSVALIYSDRCTNTTFKHNNYKAITWAHCYKNKMGSVSLKVLSDK